MFYQFQHFGLSGYFRKEYGKNFSFPSHLHQSFEFVTVTDGEMEICIDKNSYVLKKGESLLIFPNQLHSFSGNNCEHMLCIFSPELVKAYVTLTKGKIPENNKVLLSQSLLDTLSSLNEDTPIIAKKGALYSLCAQFDANAVYVEKIHQNENLLYRIFEFVESNYVSDCSLNDLAGETGFSYSYLSRYFKKIVGISFNAYVNQYRISSATCYLLNNADASILKCAYECGYKSLRSFNRNFKLLLGVTPQQYRVSAENIH